MTEANPTSSIRSATALLIRNPVARRRLSEQQLSSIAAVAREAAWRMDVISTERPGHATALAREAAERGVNVVIVHGGDGTLNEAINGLARTNTAVAVLRGGTANIWAKEAKFPKDPVAAMRAIVGGERRRVDVGRAGGRYFLLMCGVGLDAKIVRSVHHGLKRRAGAIAYVVAGASAFFGTKPWDAGVSVDGDECERSLYWMIAGNTRLYGGVLNITYGARMDDGELDLALMRRGGLHLIPDLVRVLRKRLDRSPNVRFQRTTSVEVAAPGIPVQVDGEECGETPVRIEVVPEALDVIVPRGAQSPLFATLRG